MWTSGEETFKWPWFAVALAAAVVLLLVVWALRRGRTMTPGNPTWVAHADRLRTLPRYRALVRRHTALGVCLSIAALIACAGAIVLGGRIQERQTMEQKDRSRDIMLCLDSSGSMASVDADVLREFRTIVDGLQGERIGLTIWSGVAITVFPLTDDYDFVTEQLTQAEAAFSGSAYGDNYSVFTAGTVVNYDNQSLIGDGLASCVQRFDRQDEDRSRSIVLASDNEPLGKGIYKLPEAAQYASDQKIIVHGIAAPSTKGRAKAARQFEKATTTTGGTFSLLGTDGSASSVVDAIGELEAKEIKRPPLVQVLDRPRLGTAIAGVGIAGLLVLWIVEGGLALRNRTREGRS
ncbi:MAG: hypothetical protein L0H31_06230 [Nocardioidaceae bacterium]|nr:hypothetical protein [Nocardioidaceae bacterium]